MSDNVWGSIAGILFIICTAAVLITFRSLQPDPVQMAKAGLEQCTEQGRNGSVHVLWKKNCKV